MNIEEAVRNAISENPSANRKELRSAASAILKEHKVAGNLIEVAREIKRQLDGSSANTKQTHSSHSTVFS